MSALLWKQNQSSSKHTGIRALFAAEWVRQRRMRREMGAFFGRLYEYRQKSDDGQITSSPADVRTWLQSAEAFLDAINKLILHKLAHDDRDHRAW
ncbi:MAG: HEPN domain-containing protein [Candidatus Hydrogenedentes bacterium]|nr:HEPN domain-containing protein [Candidatus Hydrogenedentota bacterium]